MIKHMELYQHQQETDINSQDGTQLKYDEQK